MASPLNKDHFLARHRDLVFNSKLEDGTASERADIIRNVLANLKFAASSGMIEQDAVSLMTMEYEDKYTDIVDSFDEHTGLNNYAAGALELCSGYKNDSQNWQSSLSLEKVRSMPRVQAAISRAQKENCCLLKNKKPSDPLPCSKGRSNKENVCQPPAGVVCPGPSISGAPIVGSTAGSEGVMNLYSGVQPLRHASELKNQPFGPASRSKGSGDQPLRPASRSREFGDQPQRASVPLCDREKVFQGQHDMPQPGYSQGREQAGNRKPLFSNGGRSHNLFGQVSGNRTTESYSHKRQYEQADGEEEVETRPVPSAFRTAKQQLDIDKARKYGGGGGQAQVNTAAYGTAKKSLGTRRGLNSKFVPPVMNREEEASGNEAANTITRAVLKTGGGTGSGSGAVNMEGMDEDKLRGIEPKMVELIMNEIMDSGPGMTWDDVAGLEFAKKTIKEIVVWPMLRPDIFTGLRGPPKGLLLFGPPGTGKTLIGKCIASQSKSTFFCISASSLTSKWVGEGEKMVRALFAVARASQPAVIFIDEIDSLLTQRTDGENEASRRIKTEFLVQLDGASTSSDDRILVIGATNRPQEIDEAARRRFVKRLYIPLPEAEARQTIITNLLRQQAHTLTNSQLPTICQRTEGFSGADMATLCREAALGPIRDMSFGDIENISADQVRPITFVDFEEALQNVRPSVSDRDLDVYLEWNKTFGSGSR
ncbi:fidgetin-like protein 1 [Mya arenaria]|uniref:fidgetin-like protein 1 n=1 Tax=Mya arenaria TaxID=6604 RepID=UPI0022E6D7A6|nr:fidgetin-like protein 1 [Mya arenaria]